MKNYVLLSLWLVLLYNIPVRGQGRITISGSVKDRETGEALIGVSVYLAGTQSGTSTNAYGYYALPVHSAGGKVVYSFVGYTTVEREILPNQSAAIDVYLDPEAKMLNEVSVSENWERENVGRLDLGLEKLSMQTIKSLPAFLGEPDVLKAIQSLPAVKSAGDGNAGFYVRGGNIDQNLIQLDEAVVYNPTHLLGFYSTFNSDILKDVALYTGTIPASYGGRLSSVMDIRTKDGNMKKFGGSGGIGILGMKLSLEGPLKKDRGAFILSGRRSFLDLLVKLEGDEARKNNIIYFYDFNAKASYALNSKNKIILSGYAGKDEFRLGNAFGLRWGNKTFTLRWNHLFNDRLFLNSTVISSRFNYEISIGSREDGADFIASITDHGVKEDFSWFASDRHTVTFGAQFIHHIFNPGQIRRNSPESPYTEFNSNKQFADEMAGYIADEFKVNSRLAISAGIRYSLYDVRGPGRTYTFASPNDAHPSDEQNFPKGSRIEAYHNLEPRLSLRYLLAENSSIKAGYSRASQNIHLASNSATALPSDLWLSSSKKVKSEIADVWTTGYSQTSFNGILETSIEAYYKKLSNQIDFRDGAQIFTNPFVERDIISGQGKAYGLETMLKKPTGSLTGWISYSLSWSKRQFDEINGGEWFFAKNDRRHQLNLVVAKKLGRRAEVSANWIYASGNAISFPTGKVYFDGQIVPVYSERNGYRMSDYHRLDLSLNLYPKKPTKRGNWNFSIYNVYGRKNTWAYEFKPSETNPDVQNLYRLYLFRFVPSVSYQFKF